jgi:hypothetical protein
VELTGAINTQTDVAIRAAAIRQHDALLETAQSSTKTGTCIKYFSITAALAILTAVVLMVMYFPLEPNYSVCENSVEWNSIIKGLGAFSLEADVDMHISLYNPNRISVEIRQGSSLDIIYHKTQVGSAALPHVHLASGSISDLNIVARFNPSTATALQMYSAHLSGSLILDISLDLNTNLKAWSIPAVQVNTSYTTSVDVDDIDYTYKYCKCQHNV